MPGGPLEALSEVRKVVAQVAQVATREQLSFARVREFLQRIRARRFEQSIALRLPVELRQNERLKVCRNRWVAPRTADGVSPFRDSS